MKTTINRLVIRTISLMLILCSISLMSYAQWTITGNIIRETDTTKKVSIGTLTNSSDLYVYRNNAASSIGVRSGNNTAILNMDKGAAGSNAAVAFKLRNTTYWNSGMLGNNNYSIKNVPAGTFPLVITATDKVGIGTSSPTAKLHVVGNIKIVDGTEGVGKVLTSDASGLASWVTPTGGGGWGLLGNAGTTVTNFMGTTDSVALNFKVYNQKAGQISPAGLVFLGFKAGNSINTGTFNTGIGYIALSSNTIGYYNTACGAGALYLNTEGYNNTAIGLNALYSNTTGYSNTVNGYAALSLNTTGYDNTASGVGALFNNLSGNGNTAFGTIAGNGNTTGAFNTFIGYNAQGAAALLNSTAIGAGAYVATNNSLVLGNNVNVGIGTSSPNAKLELAVTTGGAGQGIALTNTSPGGKTLTINQGSPGKFNFTNSGVIDLVTMDFNTNRVGIGTTTPATGYLLSVYGKIICEEVRVALHASWPDYVFEKEHQLMPIDKLAQQISKDKHLPGMPSACEVEENGGFLIGEIQIKMLENTEKNTLYIIQLHKENEQIHKENEQFRAQIRMMQTQIDNLKK